MKSILNSFQALVLLTIAVWFLSALAILYFIDDWGARGTFGDLFGAVNALFSGLAFAGLLYSLLENKRQIMAQQEELILNRQELLKARKIQEKTEEFDQAVCQKLPKVLNLFLHHLLWVKNGFFDEQRGEH